MISPIDCYGINSTLPVNDKYKRAALLSEDHRDSEEDRYEPSPLAQRWMQSGLDASSTIQGAENASLQFNLNYTASAQETFSANGYYAKQEQSLDVTFNYRFQRTVVVDGKEQLKTFEMKFSLHADKMEESVVEPFQDKEDVISFIRRLADDLMDKAADKKEKLIGVILDKKDLAEILGLEEGRIAKLIFSLIASVLMLEEIRHAGDKKDEVENVLLRAVREESNGFKLERNKSGNLSMECLITEVSSEPVAVKPVSDSAPDHAAAEIQSDIAEAQSV
jgi:hypothetical protein